MSVTLEGRSIIHKRPMASGVLFQVCLLFLPQKYYPEWFISDTVGMRALPHNAVDLHPGLPRGNLTIESCVNACQASGLFQSKWFMVYVTLTLYRISACRSGIRR